jgi:hypothetical protein
MERLQRSQVLLITLRRPKPTAWRFFSTDEESRFSYYTPHRRLWIPPDVEALEVAQQLLVTQKLMITIFWGVSGIHMIDYLPPSPSFDSACFVDHILYDFNALPIISGALRQKKLSVIRIDNSPIHKTKYRCKKSRVCR